MHSPKAERQPRGHQRVKEWMSEMWSIHTVASSDTCYNMEKPGKHYAK